MTVSLRSLLVLAPLAVVVAACGSAPEPQTESTEAPLTIRPHPPVCWDVYTPNPGCSLSAPYDGTNPTQQLLGCGPIYGYHNGANAGLLGGTGSFCPDTPANRTYLHDNNMHGFGGGYDDGCLVVPCGQIFVFWSYFLGPNCPSSCHTVPAPPSI